MSYVLKPCPFCGGKAELDKCIPCGYVHVKCTHCGATGKNLTITKEDDAFGADVIAVIAWNTRTEE